MLILRDPEEASRVIDVHARELVELRVRQLGTFDDCTLVIVEAGDSSAALEQATGCPLLSDPFTDTQYGDADFTPSADAIEDQGHVYTLLFVTTDEYAVEFIVPKGDGIDRRLLAMCAQYAVPAETIAEP